MSRQTVYVGSDHAGFILKTQLLKKLRAEFLEYEFKDLGCDSEASVNYPDFAEKVARLVAAEKIGKGILICGSGLGMCIAANKISGIRATSSWSPQSAHLSREHNDSNIICLGARLITEEVALESVREWLKTPFAGGRHLQRLELITKLEEKK